MDLRGTNGPGRTLRNPEEFDLGIHLQSKALLAILRPPWYPLEYQFGCSDWNYAGIQLCDIYDTQL